MPVGSSSLLKGGGRAEAKAAEAHGEASSTGNRGGSGLVYAGAMDLGPGVSHGPGGPDHLGALIDILTEGGSTRLSIQEAVPAAFDASPRLQEIADQYRASMPVRVVAAVV